MESLFGDKYYNKYDSKRAYALYKIYATGDDDALDDVLRAVAPWVRAVVIRAVRNFEWVDRSSLEVLGLEQVWKALIKKKVDMDGTPKTFSNYISAVVGTHTRNEVKKARQKFLELSNVADLIRTNNQHSMIQLEKVETLQAYRKILWEIWQASKANIRFKGVGRNIVLDLIDIHCLNKDISMSWIKKKYNLTKEEFQYYKDYTQVLLRIQKDFVMKSEGYRSWAFNQFSTENLPAERYNANE